MRENLTDSDGEISTRLFVFLIGPTHPKQTKRIVAILLHPTQEDLAYDA